MKNAVAPGETIPWTNTSGSNVVSGQIVAMGHTLGVAVVDIPTGGTGTVRIDGAVTAPKVSAAVFVQGEKLVWDISANDGKGAFDDSAATPAAGDITGGAIARKAGANLETTCEVILTKGNATLTAGGG